MNREKSGRQAPGVGGPRRPLLPVRWEPLERPLIKPRRVEARGDQSEPVPSELSRAPSPTTPGQVPRQV